MNTQDTQAESHETPENQQTCCSQKEVDDMDADVTCSGCQNKSCNQCGGGASKNNQIAILGAAACVGYLLGWLLERRK